MASNQLDLEARLAVERTRKLSSVMNSDLQAVTGDMPHFYDKKTDFANESWIS